MTATVEAIWQEFSVQLRRFIGTRVPDAASADDILQDVFLKIQKNLGNLDSTARLQSWIYLVARNSIIDYHRLRKETVELPETLEAESQAEDPGLDELKASFRRMIHQLPEPYREALVLTEFQGLTQKQLAERLGISVSGAKSRVQRGREQLRKMLAECCQFEFDRRGRVIDCTPRPRGGCQECS